MSPQHKADMVSGPPTLVNLSNGPKKGLVGTIDNEDIDRSEAVVLFINEESLSRSPLVEISLGDNMEVRAMLDSGSEVNVLAESICEKLIDLGGDIPNLLLEDVILLTANAKRSDSS
jgi:hypothetical protein